MGDRAVYCARLESVCAERHPGFESPPIRAFFLPALLVLLFCLVATARSANPENAYAGDLIEAATSDYKAGHFDSGLTKLDQHDKAKGLNGSSLDLRGSIALEQGKFDVALKAFTESHKLEPALFAPRLHLGDLFLREKKYSDAHDVYQRLLSETNILISNERLRYAMLVIALARHEEAAARSALENIKFPTESPSYYCAQAAWEFAHGNERSAKKWIATASEIFEPQLIAWFARPLYDLGWLKEKPPSATL